MRKPWPDVITKLAGAWPISPALDEVGRVSAGLGEDYEVPGGLNWRHHGFFTDA